MANIQELVLPIDTKNQLIGQQARREMQQFGDYLKNLPEKGWLKQSFCTDWTIKDVVQHQLIQSINMRDVVIAISKNERPPLISPETLTKYRTEIADLNRLERVDYLAQTTNDFYDLLEKASPEQLQAQVELPVAELDLATLGGFRLSELALHSWDVRVVDNLATKISRESLPLLFPGLINSLSFLANSEILANLQNATYQFEVEGAVRGPVLMQVENGKVKTRTEYANTDPDVTIKLDSDSFLRLAWGRLRNLDQRIRQGWVKVDGDVDKALVLTQIFQGV